MGGRQALPPSIFRDDRVGAIVHMATIASLVAVVGLGYVGLPLAVEFGKRYRTIGVDLSRDKVASYERHEDPTGEVASADLQAASMLSFSTDPSTLTEADFIVVAVPTPVDEAHQPDFTPLIKSSESVGRYLKHGATVVYESTVYPGATEEVCIPILERVSGLKWKREFFVESNRGIWTNCNTRRDGRRRQLPQSAMSDAGPQCDTWSHLVASPSQRCRPGAKPELP